MKKREPTKGILFLVVFIPKLHINPLTSCYLKNIDYLVSHTPYFDKMFCFSLFALEIFGFLISFFPALQAIQTHCLINRLKSLMSWESF